MKNKLLTKLLMVLLPLATMLSCIKDGGVAPAAVIVTQTDNTKPLLINDEIRIELEFNLPYEDLDILWSVNGQPHSRIKDFVYTVKSPGVVKILLMVKNSVAEIEQTFLYEVRKYKDGYFVVNEGVYNAQIGSVNYFNRTSQKIYTNVVSAPKGLEVGVTSSMGIVSEGFLYVTSKVNNHVVKVDLNTFECVAALRDDTQLGQAHDMADCGYQSAVLSAQKGLFFIDINDMKITKRISSDNTLYGDVYVDKQYVYAVSKERGLEIYDREGLTLKKTVGKGVCVGIKATPNGKVWAAATDRLIGVSPSDLSVEEVMLPQGVAVYDNWFAWRSGILTASTKENVVYFAVSQWSGDGNKIYRYEDGKRETLTSVFAKGADDDTFYGESIKYDPITNSLIAIFIKSGWGENSKVNRLVYFDAKTGAQSYRFVYPELNAWFPSAIVFEK